MEELDEDNKNSSWLMKIFSLGSPLKGIIDEKKACDEKFSMEDLFVIDFTRGVSMKMLLIGVFCRDYLNLSESRLIHRDDYLLHFFCHGYLNLSESRLIHRDDLLHYFIQ